MRRDLRRNVRERFNFCCGYCGVREDEIGAALTIDHFQPRSQGGSDELENLVYACHACNEFKGDFWPAADQTRFLHPRTDDLTIHLRALQDGTLEGLTPEGVLWIERLRLNRAPQLERRRRQSDYAGEAAENARLKEELAALKRRVQQLTGDIENI